jgi:hypothetical protein
VTAAVQRWRDRRGAWRPASELIQPSRYTVDVIERTTAARFVEAHHYSGSYVASRLQVGLFEGLELVGVAAFSVGVQPKAVPRWCGVPTAAGVELGRFVLLDRVPGNGETWFLARAFAALRAELPELLAVLSYSDPMPRRTDDGHVVMPGHVGVIYQGHNGRYLGCSSPRSIWLDRSGQVVSRRTLDKVLSGDRGHAAAVDELVRLGAPRPGAADLRAWLPGALRSTCRQVRHPGNHVYAWPLDRSASLAPSQPYPRRGAA